MIYLYELDDVETIDHAIESRQKRIADIEENLKYADHGAYGQDKTRIYELRADITELTRRRQQKQETAA